MEHKQAVFNWSGGKDSSLALHRILHEGETDIRYLLTSVSERYNRISMHGVRIELLEEQARQIGLPLVRVMIPESVSMDSYDAIMKKQAQAFREEGITHSVFGDIFLEDLRKYREEKLAEAGMAGIFPLWHEDTGKLAEDFIRLGFKAIVTCVHGDHLDESFAGREYNEHFLADLPEGADPCGENGEFHTFVYEGPLYRQAIPVKKGETVVRTMPRPAESCVGDGDDPAESTAGTITFYYCDLLPL